MSQTAWKDVLKDGIRADSLYKDASVRRELEPWRHQHLSDRRGHYRYPAARFEAIPQEALAFYDSLGHDSSED